MTHNIYMNKSNQLELPKQMMGQTSINSVNSILLGGFDPTASMASNLRGSSNVVYMSNNGGGMGMNGGKSLRVADRI
jgi:hypothetical protein